MHVLNYHHSTLSFDALGEDDKFKYQCVNTLVNTDIESIKIIIPRLEEIKIDGWNNTYYLGCMLWKIED